MFSEKLIRFGSCVVTTSSMWNRSARKRRSFAPDAPHTCSSRDDLRQYSSVRVQDLIREWSEERPYAVGRDDSACTWIGLPETVANADLVLLHALDGFGAKLATTLSVVRERRVHDDRVHVAQREVDILALVNLFGIEVVERPPRRDHLEQVEVLRVGVEDLKRARLERPVRLRPVRHRQQVHARVVHRRGAKREVAGGELDGVLVDVETAEHVFDKMPVQDIAHLLAPSTFREFRNTRSVIVRSAAMSSVPVPHAGSMTLSNRETASSSDQSAKSSPSASLASMMADRLFV